MGGVRGSKGALRTPPGIWSGEVENFVPFKVSSGTVAMPEDTTVVITSANVTDIELVLTFEPNNPVERGVARVAAFQTVTSNVRLDLTAQAALCWIASVRKAGDLSPNQNQQPFTDNSDSFRLNVTDTITLTHDNDGWAVPHYHEGEYTVNVGFGLKIGGWVYWAYSVLCTPGQRVAIDAGSYELVRSDGAEQLGAPLVLEGMSHWRMPIGSDYQLTFDASGNGTLSQQSSE